MASYKPLKPCIHPGCPALIASGARCDEHKKLLSAGHDLARGSAAQRGYDAAWLAVRAKALKRDGYLCQHCLLEGKMIPATLVDHIRAIKGRDDPGRLDIKNLQALCRTHHNVKGLKYDGLLGRPKQKIGD